MFAITEIPKYDIFEPTIKLPICQAVQISRFKTNIFSTFFPKYARSCILQFIYFGQR